MRERGVTQPRHVARVEHEGMASHSTFESGFNGSRSTMPESAPGSNLLLLAC